MPAESVDGLQEFCSGVTAARDHGDLGLSHQLFSVRTLGLAAAMQPSALASYMSGLLIGHELRAGLEWRRQQGLQGGRIALIGETALTHRYKSAFRLFGVADVTLLGNTAAAGLFRLSHLLL
jgi:2-dehydro-3-deoxygalactonokinase